MTIEHRDIPDAGRHEPKHGSAAEAGQVLTSLGNDQTEFKNLGFDTTDECFFQSTEPQWRDVGGTTQVINYGDGGTSENGDFTVSNLGLITFNFTGTYDMQLKMRAAREGTAGTASLMFKPRFNGDPLPVSTTEVNISGSDGSATAVVDTFISQPVTVGDTLEYVMLYDIQPGSDRAGVAPFFHTNAPTASHWPPTPSASIKLTSRGLS
jgi:hypothetical protein